MNASQHPKPPAPNSGGESRTENYRAFYIEFDDSQEEDAFAPTGWPEGRRAFPEQMSLPPEAPTNGAMPNG
jgi:hypothetical protein